MLVSGSAAGIDVDALDHALNAESGLLALGDSAGMRELEHAALGGSGERARDRRLLHRVAGAVGAMAVAAGGLDAVVFTGGIGEIGRGPAEDLAPARLPRASSRPGPERRGRSRRRRRRAGPGPASS